MKCTLPLVMMASLTLLSGCTTTGPSASSYSVSQAQQAQQVEFGTVQSVRPVVIQGEPGAVGALGGATVGALAGRAIGGSGSSGTVGAVAGGVLGGLAGSAAQRQVTTNQGLEIVVDLDRGSTIAVTQVADNNFFPGQRVRVLRAADGTTRITP